MGEQIQFKISRDETLRETISHGTSGYPLAYYYEDVYMFDFHCVDWHWHPELELVYIKEGKLNAYIGADKITVKAGQALLINENVMHKLDSKDHAIIPNIVFMTDVLAPEGSVIYKKYITPVVKSSFEYLVLSKDTEWMLKTLKDIKKLMDIQEADKNELKSVRTLLKIWDSIYSNTGYRFEENVERNTTSQVRLQIMMQYIQDNYEKKITLEDIAGCVSMSKSSVLNIFNSYLQTTPVGYLVSYRIKMAAGMLSHTQESVADIAYKTGFDNIGYFCRKFKQITGVTPSKYREKGM